MNYMNIKIATDQDLIKHLYSTALKDYKSNSSVNEKWFNSSLCFLAATLAHKQTFTMTSVILSGSGYKIKLLDCSKIKYKGTP